MFRFPRIIVISKTLIFKQSPSNHINLSNFDAARRISISSRRHYCTKHDSNAGGGSSNVGEKVVLKPCKPVSIDPCKTDKLPTKQAAGSDACAKSEICSRIKKADEKPWVPPPPPPPNRMWILWTITATCAALALYIFGVFDKKEVKSVKPKKSKMRKKRTILKDPAKITDIPTKVPYVLIGGGTASFSAFRAIKSADPTAKVLIISNEGFYPYMRPPLSKEMWFNSNHEEVMKELTFRRWDGTKRNLYFEPEAFYIKCKELMDSENGGVAVARGYAVSHINVLDKTIVLEDEEYEIEYDKCLIATGAQPKSLPIFEAAVQDDDIEEKVKLFRNIYDFQDLFEAYDKAKSIVVIGSGFIGSELSCALSRKSGNNKAIYQIFREDGVMGKILPKYLSDWATAHVKKEGVTVLAQSEVVGIKRVDDKLLLTMNSSEGDGSGKAIEADFVVVAVGVEPNTAMAEKSDLEVDPALGGFVVNTELQARKDLYIAGDCACFYDIQLGRRRIEHFDQAVVTGRLAGENMTGEAKPYTHQSMFWSDLGPDVGYEAIGIVDASLPTVGVFVKQPSAADAASDGDTPAETTKIEEQANPEACDLSEAAKQLAERNDDFSKGVVFYLRDDIVVGVVLWNLFNRMSIARQVIKDGKKHDDLNEVAKLFKIHEE